MVVRFSVVYWRLVKPLIIIHYGKLFNMLINRNLPAYILFAFCLMITVDNNLEQCGIHVTKTTSACQTG